MNDLKILYIEDDEENRKDLIETLSGMVINNHTVVLDCESDFEKALSRSKEYNLVILDRFKGDATQGGEDAGSDVFENVKNSFFVPVIFYSGCVNDILDRKSQVVGVASKGEDYMVLVSEITRLTKHNIPFLKNGIQEHIEKVFKSFFWNVIHEENKKFIPEAGDYSLGYMLLRNFANSLSKENIKSIIGDDAITSDKVHPMEFYIYPIDSTMEFENAEIVRKKDADEVYVILTPSCDFVSGGRRKRKAEYVLLATTVRLEETSEYKEYIKVCDFRKDIDEIDQRINHDNIGEIDGLKEKKQKIEQKINTNTASFKQFLNSSKSDRFFFLPGTPFIENRVIDFQKQVMVRYDSLNVNYNRLTKLDSPFAQSMIAQFIRYYNRIGFPDIDADYVIGRLNQ